MGEEARGECGENEGGCEERREGLRNGGGGMSSNATSKLLVCSGMLGFQSVSNVGPT